MRQRLIWSLRFLPVLLIAASSCAQDAELQPESDDALLAALGEGIDMGLPGISAAIGVGDEVVWTGTAGFSDVLGGVPVTPSDRFGVGSITKTMV
ncbi:MAG: serine hydrolase, partial [Gemmatimonadales bacterium]|nr:serine hydrolase [Gemmatimonadales bacterium]